MSVTLKFWNKGLPFEPRVLLADVEAYEAAEMKAAETGLTVGKIARARADFLAAVLGRDGKQDAVLALSVPELNEAFWPIWKAATSQRDPSVPLEQPSAASQPSPSPASK